MLVNTFVNDVIKWICFMKTWVQCLWAEVMYKMTTKWKIFFSWIFSAILHNHESYAFQWLRVISLKFLSVWQTNFTWVEHTGESDWHSYCMATIILQLALPSFIRILNGDKMAQIFLPTFTCTCWWSEEMTWLIFKMVHHKRHQILLFYERKSWENNPWICRALLSD